VVRISNGFWTVVVVVDLLWGLVCNTSSSRHLASASSAISLCIAQQGQSVPQDAIPLRALTRSATGLCASSNSAAICARINVGKPSLTEHLSELLSGYAALELTIYPYGDFAWRDRFHRGIGVGDAHAAAEQRTKH
jgi:hypothetical protein